jgi:hypothetical protein
MATDSLDRGTGLSFARAWVYAGLTIGILDIADALIFYGARGVAPHRIFQSVASGLLGKAAFNGGLGVEILGGVIHFCIAFTMALFYLVLARRWRTFANRPWIWGPLYGLGAWFVMYHVVLPLVGAAPATQKLAVLVDEIAIHVLGVGLPAALFAARVRWESR